MARTARPDRSRLSSAGGGGRRLDGIYFHGEQFFRFYPDGFFLDVWIRGGDPASLTGVWAWFHREEVRAGVRQGRYRQAGSRVAFETTSPIGADERLVRYAGTYERGRLVLDRRDETSGGSVKGLAFSRLPPLRRLAPA